MQELDDNALLREYGDHASEEAFATLVARHINKVYSVALRHTRNPHQAEEITQAVFVILARKSRHLGRRVVLSGWLYHTARLTAMTSIRSDIRRAHREQEARMQTLLDETESEVWPQIAPLLDAAMAGLSEADRHAVVLRFFDGKSTREVGIALGASEDAAKMRVNRAVEKLRLFFAKRGIVHPASVLTDTISAHSVEAAPVALAKAVTNVALAKGATASGSTLTLIKGALKIMAWTKAKTAVVAAIAVIVAGGTTTVVFKRIQAANVTARHGIEGAWEGVMHLEAPGVAAGQAASTHVVLKFTKTNAGYKAAIDLIDQGRKDIRIDSVDYNYPLLRLEWKPGQIWNLSVNPAGTEMVWDRRTNFIQPDPVTLQRTATPDPVPERLAESDFAPRAGSDLQGFWQGAIGAGPDALPVDFKISEPSDGTFQAELDSYMQGADGQPVSVVYSGRAVKLLVASGLGMFQGEINGAHTEMSGSWLQGGKLTPANFKRGDYQAELAREAAGDYSFASENDLQGHWKGSWTFNNQPVNELLDIAKLPDGTFAATVVHRTGLADDDPIPASAMQYTPPSVRLEWKWARTGFEGALKNGKLTGNWIQGGVRWPLVLERRH